MAFLSLKLHGCGIPVDKTILKQGRTASLLLFNMSSLTITFKCLLFYKNKSCHDHSLVSRVCILSINVFFSKHVGTMQFFLHHCFENGGQSCYFVLLLRFIYSSLLFRHAVSRGDNCFLIFMREALQTVSCKVHTLSHFSMLSSMHSDSPVWLLLKFNRKPL